LKLQESISILPNQLIRQALVVFHTNLVITNDLGKLLSIFYDVFIWNSDLN